MRTAQEKILGRALRRTYDLPLSKEAGTGFLRLLITLMAVLSVLSLVTVFALSSMTARWSSGLKDKATVEIPAGETLPETIRDVIGILDSTPEIREFRVMQDSDLEKLIAPWLGKDFALSGIPVPGLISVDFEPGAALNIDALEGRLQKKVDPGIRIDTHQSWLRDVTRFAGSLEYAALFLTAVIGLTIVVAVAGAVRSKMTIHKAEIELLHLMGASDNYISRQFQHHMMVLALQGTVPGVVLGILAVYAIAWTAPDLNTALLPDFSLSTLQRAALLSIPVVIAAIAAFTARWTVGKTLREMP